MEQNTYFIMFPGKIWGGIQENVTKRRHKMLMSCEDAQLKNGSGWISLSSTLLSDNGVVDQGQVKTRGEHFEHRLRKHKQ